VKICQKFRKIPKKIGKNEKNAKIGQSLKKIKLQNKQTEKRRTKIKMSSKKRGTTIMIDEKKWTEI